MNTPARCVSLRHASFPVIFPPMKALSVWLIFVVFVLLPGRTQAHFAPIETSAVPIDRVLANLERDLRKDTNDVSRLYYLARVQAMAFAGTLSTLAIITNHSNPLENGKILLRFDSGLPEGASQPGFVPPANAAPRAHLTNSIRLYQRAADLLGQGTNATAHHSLILPIHLGLAWTLDQSGRRPEAIKAYRRALQLAWHDEVDQTLPLKERLSWSWDQLRTGRNPLSRPAKSLGAGMCYSEEIIRCLLPVLDPQRDAKEIAQLNQDKATLNSIPRWITPLLIPLQSGTPFPELVNPAAAVPFDLDGSGFLRRWGWITSKAAWLVYDHDGTGHITSGLQLFGNVTFWIFWRDGYAALASLDDDGDGQLSGAELRHLALWQDRNGNGICEPGEVRPLAEFGITALDCGSQPHFTGIPFNPTGVHYRDGSTQPSYDWIAPSSSAPISDPR